MASAGGGDRLADDEILYRRIPVSTGWCDGTVESVSPQAFRPRKHDSTGLSLFRARLISPEMLAVEATKPYFVAELIVRDLRDAEIDVELDDPTKPEHVALPGLRYDNRRSDAAEETIRVLARQLVRSVIGPFPRQR